MWPETMIEYSKPYIADTINLWCFCGQFKAVQHHGYLSIESRPIRHIYQMRVQTTVHFEFKPAYQDTIDKFAIMVSWYGPTSCGLRWAYRVAISNALGPGVEGLWRLPGVLLEGCYKECYSRLSDELWDGVRWEVTLPAVDAGRITVAAITPSSHHVTR